MVDKKIPKLLDTIRKKGNKLDLDVFKKCVIGIFDDVLRNQEIKDPEKEAKIARLRAKIEIEFKDL